MDFQGSAYNDDSARNCMFLVYIVGSVSARDEKQPSTRRAGSFYDEEAALA